MAVNSRQPPIMGVWRRRPRTQACHGIRCRCLARQSLVRALVPPPSLPLLPSLLGLPDPSRSPGPCRCWRSPLVARGLDLHAGRNHLRGLDTDAGRNRLGPTVVPPSLASPSPTDGTGQPAASGRPSPSRPPRHRSPARLLPPPRPPARSPPPHCPPGRSPPSPHSPARPYHPPPRPARSPPPLRNLSASRQHKRQPHKAAVAARGEGGVRPHLPGRLADLSPTTTPAPRPGHRH